MQLTPEPPRNQPSCVPDAPGADEGGARLTIECIWITLKPMRTTLDIPAKLVEEARRILGVRSKSDAVVLSLAEVVRRRRVDELKEMRGKIDLYVEISKSRRRPGRPAKTAASGGLRRSR